MIPPPSNIRSPLMNKPSLLLSASLALVGIFLVGCGGGLRYQIVLNDGETLAEGTPVFVDSIEAGKVVSTGNEGGDRVADIVITAREVKERLRVGAIRVPEPGKVVINSDFVTADDQPLPRGARIPTKSKLVYLVEQYSRGSALITVAVALVGLVVVYLVFKGLMGSLLTIVAIAMAAITAQLTHRFALPLVERVYRYIGPPPIVTPAPGGSGEASPEAGTAAGKLVGDMNATIQDVISQMPPPGIVAFAVIGFISLVLYLWLLRRITRRLHP